MFAFHLCPNFLFLAISRIFSEINEESGLSLKPDLFTCYF